ncbi:MAG: signal peptidase I [Desulfuromonadaceae bacterium]|nr:signal peptidase I [Desulfuromonadaceae bacterium]
MITKDPAVQEENAGEEPTPAVSKKTHKSKVREWVEAIIVAALLALVIRSLVVQAYKIPSGSMEDTLLIGDHLLVNKFIYGTKLPFIDERFLVLREPQRGDVVVFEFPEDRDQSYFKRRDFIKRVIGVPGDKIEISNKQVFVNGQPLALEQAVFKEPNVLPQTLSPRDNFGPVVVPPESLFVMGDNRDRSYDSRFWGFVAYDALKGLAFIKYWSWDADKFFPRFGRIGRPID